MVRLKGQILGYCIVGGGLAIIVALLLVLLLA